MKQKLIEYLESQPDTYNKNATRYLYKRNPELWNWIIQVTSFLPDDSLPKQRIWHILNDNFIRPVCPVTGEFVKWWENRYLQHSSKSATGRCPSVAKKRMTTYKEKTGFEHWNVKENLKGYNKLKSTHFENWGTWSSKTEECHNKFLKTKIQNGYCRTEEQKSELEKYNELVKNYTKDSWYYHYSKINPLGLKRGKEYHLDHIYSRKKGFDNNIPPEIIGHWTNLRLIKGRQNNGKSSKCDKTLEKLFEDYYNNGGLFNLNIFRKI